MSAILKPNHHACVPTRRATGAAWRSHAVKTEESVRMLAWVVAVGRSRSRTGDQFEVRAEVPRAVGPWLLH